MRSPIKTLMWVENHFPQDTRVRNEAALLTDAGYKVSVIALRKPGQLGRETLERCRNLPRANAGTV